MNVPADFLTVATPEPSESTVDVSLAHFAPVTVLSAVTWTWFVLGSIDQAVPGMVASDFSVLAAVLSVDRLLLTLRGTAPLSRRC